MMEGVRRKTEGGSAPAPVEAKASAMPDQATLDAMLMKKADQATATANDFMKNFQDPTVKKALVTQKAKVEVHETKEQRAARYFATHGMKKMGHALGEELSTDAEKKALKEHAEMEQKLSEVPVPKSQASHSSGSQDLEPIDMDEDDDDQTAEE